MNTIILIAIALAFVLTIRELLKVVSDDRPTHQPRSHFEDPTLRSPGAWS